MKRILKIAFFLLFLGLANTALAQVKTTYVYTDPQGTPIAEADEAGVITASFEYTPFGVPVGSSVSDGPGFTSHVNDSETGLVYMQARYFDPAAGAFLSGDPVRPGEGDLFNFGRYAYGNGNPFTHTDPTGMDDCGPNCDENRAKSDKWISFGTLGGSGTVGDAKTKVPINDEEKSALAAGDLQKFWQSRLERGDPWAPEALGIWDPSNNAVTAYDRAIAQLTVARLVGKLISRDMPKFDQSSLSSPVIAAGMQANYAGEIHAIGVAIAKGYANAVHDLDGAVPTLAQSVPYHYVAFKAHGLPPSTYGATPLGDFMPATQAYIVNELVQYCPRCSP